jgi:hypothetical protein
LETNEQGISHLLQRERMRWVFPHPFDGLALVRQRPAPESKIETIRRDVQMRGECIVRYDDLHALCADVRPPLNYWEVIAKIAIDEGWSFTFFPDRRVRFAPLSSCR